MAQQTLTDEIEVKVSAQRLWWALVKDAHNFLPKCLPDKIASVEYEGAPATPGCIRTVKFHKPTPDGSILAREKVEEVNAEKFYIKFVVVEGGLSGLFKNIKVALHLKEGPHPGTTVVSSKIEYEATGEQKLPPEGRNAVVGEFKAVEAYLQTHNDYA